MNITDLELTNFRKFDKLKLKNLNLVNIIIGKNGVGKTSIIESIYFGSVSKSFKSYYDEVLIKEKEQFLKVKICLNDEKIFKKTEIVLNGKKKTAKIDDKIINKLSSYVGQYSVILFSPDDIRLIKDSPIVRRNYLNIRLSNINKKYLKVINDYNKIIKNKNDYLKKLYLNKNLDSTYLDILDKKIAELGIYINTCRNEYINNLNKYVDKIFKNFKKDDNIKFVYISEFNNKSEKEITAILKKARKKEMESGLTNTGIHRDDIRFIYNKKDAENYASQGIQKLILLSMKFSEIKTLSIDYKIKPILLLDDLFSELDTINQRKVMRLFNKKFQTFITTTDLNNVKIKNKDNINIIKLKEEKNEK